MQNRSEAVVPRERIVLLDIALEKMIDRFSLNSGFGKKFLRIATEYGDL